jgi:CheY-like chemotaxis protein
MGNIELAAAKVPAEIETGLRAAEQACARAAELVEQLMVFSRKVAPARRPVSMSALVYRVAGICRTTFDRRVAVHVSVPPDPVWVLANLPQVEQVILNLCINSRDAVLAARREGSAPCVDLSLEEVACDPAGLPPQTGSPAGEYARIRVSDNGVGIDERGQQRVFEPFYTTKEVGKGTGLGLTTAYAITRQHGGWIMMGSEAGRGTVFEVYLPTTAQTAGPDSAPASGPPRGTGGVLVIDDEETVRRVVGISLARHGYQVYQAADGEEGLRVFRREKARLALVLLDLSMPGLSGADTLNALRRTDPGIPIVLCTGDAEGTPGDLQADGVLRKPFPIAELLRTVGQAARA